MALEMSTNRGLQPVHPGAQIRSDLVFGAIGNVSNRYLLTKLASKAIRGMHKPGARIEDTINDVLAHVSRANPIGCRQAQPEPLKVPLLPKMTVPAIQLKAKVTTLTPAGVKSNPLWDADRALGA
jgi:hypothetical protein